MVTAGVIALIILTLLSALQIAVALGVPLGHYVWGGQHKILPKNLRIGSAISPIIYAVFGAFAVSKGDLMTIVPDGSLLNTGIWIMSAYFVIGVAMNAISRSKPERYTMTPVCVILAVCFIIIARG